MLLALEVHAILAIAATIPHITKRIDLDETDLQIRLPEPRRFIGRYGECERNLLQDRVFPADPSFDLEIRLRDLLPQGEGWRSGVYDPTALRQGEPDPAYIVLVWLHGPSGGVIYYLHMPHHSQPSE